jgi:hypothetical protein
MNVFVLCTGRCGSKTFIKACRHISNYSSAHESRIGLVGAERLRYPLNHIEADNRLSWLLGRLDRIYGDEAFYVHLTRDMKAVAASFVKRYNMGIMYAYRSGGILMGVSRDTDPAAVATDYCDTVDSNIELFLKNKSRKMTFQLECARQDFPAFCNSIGAEVDLPRALSEFDTRYNASAPRKPLSLASLQRFSLARLQRFSLSRLHRLLLVLASGFAELHELLGGVEDEIVGWQGLC